MIALALIAAFSDPELVTLRYENAQASWEMCIDNRLGHMSDAERQGVPKSAMITAAIDQCHDFGEDFKRTLPEVAIEHFSDQGVTSYSRSVVDLLADEIFKVVTDHIRSVREAPANER